MKNRIKEIILQAGNFIVLLAVALIFFMSFAKFGFKREWDADFWITTSVGMILMTMTYFSKMRDHMKISQRNPEFTGVRKERTDNVNKVLGKNENGILVNKGLTNEFNTYIEECNKENKIAYLSNKFNGVGLEYNDYIAGKYKDKALSKRQKKVISKYENGKYRIKKQLIAATFLTGVQYSLPHKIVNRESTFISFESARRILLFIINSGFLSAILIQRGTITTETFIRVLMWLMTIAFAFIDGVRVGTVAIMKYRREYILSQNLIVTNFLSRYVNNVDN